MSNAMKNKYVYKGCDVFHMTGGKNIQSIPKTDPRFVKDRTQTVSNIWFWSYVTATGVVMALYVWRALS